MKIENSIFKIHKLDSVESTNRYCEALDLAEVGDFTCYWALEQTAGIGQRGNHWASEAGKNLTFSLVLHPDFLPADRQFRLTQALSLAIVDFLSPFTSHLASAVCGIGLNVNQTLFPDWVPNPTSLALLMGKECELEPLLHQLLACMEKRYSDLKSGVDPEPEYLEHLLNLGVEADYSINEGAQVLPAIGNPLSAKVTATITGVDPHGRLLLTTTDGRRLSCGMKEIVFL